MINDEALAGLYPDHYLPLISFAIPNAAAAAKAPIIKTLNAPVNAGWPGYLTFKISKYKQAYQSDRTGII